MKIYTSAKNEQSAKNGISPILRRFARRGLGARGRTSDGYTMIEILTQAAAQVPALVVLCLLVYIFVNSLKAERTAIETIASEALDRNTEAMAQNHQVIRAAVDSLNRNTEMLGRTLAVVERMERRRGNGSLPNQPK